MKMKVKILSRNPADHIRERVSDIHKLPRNVDPALHPFEAPREYTKALNAVKLERVFAKPFVGALDGHTDGVNCLARHPRSLSVLLSGSCDGEVNVNFFKKKKLEDIWEFEDSIVENERLTSFFSEGPTPATDYRFDAISFSPSFYKNLFLLKFRELGKLCKVRSSLVIHEYAARN